jgi:hypothetical protein
VNNLHKLIKIVGYSLATIGFIHVVKHVIHSKECREGWNKIKVEEKKRTGSRYGSNPVRY